MPDIRSSEVLGNRHTISVAGCDYAVWLKGVGYPILLLHGWPVTSLRWRHVIPTLVERGFRTISIDLRGLGASYATDGQLAKEHLAKEIHRVISCLEDPPTRIAVIGHDWGASVAIALCSVSDQVSVIVIEEEIAPGIEVGIPEPGASHYPTWHGAFHRQAPLAEMLIGAQQHAYFSFFLGLRDSPQNPDDAQAFLTAYSDPTRLSLFLEYYRTYASDVSFYRRLSERRLAVPALALGGRYGMGTAVATAARRLFTSVDQYVFERSGHYPAEEEPSLYADEVLRFFRAHAVQ